MADILHGKVKFFNCSKGFGFIEQANGPDLFVHFSGIQDDGYKTLEDGQTVRFTISDGPKGPHATDVVAV
ncbi:cold-shock protein [Psychrobium sp. 1_MG-2023]|uniref:cold-shock protein n=1 Tax=Psychrobium sp. 1_MG-2023 TaxID=3062624 RepID=UPI000C34D811|nr:cold-shock protein [Psychrobium sp. 1_MG-2023]MDP2559784.1 cold-shock protein [Psychrobium sp. 1_MG-2023]PKF59108.1 cold-shock protein [Alteromonadales bacterium alter-6D02]